MVSNCNATYTSKLGALANRQLVERTDIMANQPKLPLTDLVTAMFTFKPNRVARPDLQDVVVQVDMMMPLDPSHVKMLWDIEHLFNALPSVTRVHVDVQEQKEPVKSVKTNEASWHNLVEGHRYRVRYRIIGLHRADHEFVGTYLSDVPDKLYATAQFSLRPISGTSTLEYRHILEVTEVAKTVPHFNPRRTR